MDIFSFFQADYAKVVQLLNEGAEANTQDNNGMTISSTSLD